MRKTLDSTVPTHYPSTEKVEELPIPVSSDWDEQVDKANAVAATIDKHLDYERKHQGKGLTPIRLCPEQRVNMVSDAIAAARR